MFLDKVPQEEQVLINLPRFHFINIHKLSIFFHHSNVDSNAKVSPTSRYLQLDIPITSKYDLKY